MPRPGLRAEKRPRKGKQGTHLATYWVKSEQLQRLAKARKEGLLESRMPSRNQQQLRDAAERAHQEELVRAQIPRTPRLTTAHDEVVANLLAPPHMRRTGGLAPDKKPPVIALPAFHADTEGLASKTSLTVAETRRFFAHNEEEFVRVGSAFATAFTKDYGGINSVQALSEEHMTQYTSPKTLGSYAIRTGAVYLREGSAQQIGDSILGKNVATQDAYIGITMFTHESLHAGSPTGKPDPEPRGAILSPHRWIEEATTELLAQHYTDQTVKAFTGKTSGTPSYDIVTQVARGSAHTLAPDGPTYPYQCQRFANLVGYIAGVKPTDSSKEINRVVLGYAAEVKKRGRDRFEYLAEEALKAHGVVFNTDTSFYAEARRTVTESLKKFMGARLDSDMTKGGNTPKQSAQEAVEDGLRAAYNTRAQTGTVKYPIVVERPATPTASATPAVARAAMVTPLAEAAGHNTPLRDLNFNPLELLGAMNTPLAKATPKVIRHVPPQPEPVPLGPEPPQRAIRPEILMRRELLRRQTAQRAKEGR